MASLANILGWWQTSRVPTVEQRNQTFNSYRHKDDPIQIAEVTGLNDRLNDMLLDTEQTALGNFTRAFTAKSALEKMAIVPQGDIVLTIGTTPGGNDIMDAQPVLTGNTILFTVDLFFLLGGTIYFSGVTSTTYFKFFQRK